MANSTKISAQKPIMMALDQSGEKFITFGDLDKLKNWVLIQVGGLFVGLLGYLWSVYQKSKDKTSETLIEQGKKIDEALYQIQLILKDVHALRSSVVTRDNLSQYIRDEITYADELSRKRQ